jgi:ligand-binding sensor domain-containing protein
MNRTNRNAARTYAIVAFTCLALIGVKSPPAWCGNLWSATFCCVESFPPKQLKKSRSVEPEELVISGGSNGLAFDKSHNLWVATTTEVLKFTPAQLKKLKTDSNPSPVVTITSSTFHSVIGCAFDPHGNLWLVDDAQNSFFELSMAQLNAGSADVTPAIIISSAELDSPRFPTFDRSGDLWIDSLNNSKIVEFSPDQLDSGGSKTPSVVISDDGSGSSVDEPTEITFDRKGDMWVANYGSDTVVEFSPSELKESGSRTPIVNLSSTVADQDGDMSLEAPEGVAFEGTSLVVRNFNEGASIVKFSSKQLKTSGSPVPKVYLPGHFESPQQLIVGPAS